MFNNVNLPTVCPGLIRIAVAPHKLIAKAMIGYSVPADREIATFSLDLRLNFT